MAYPPSHLSRLLDSNILPNSFEAQCVQHIVSKLCGQISELQSQLERLQQQMRRHTAILSPIRRVPPEILGRIFAFASPGRLDDVGRSDLLNLGLVCRGWRDASLLEHQLWSSLRIKPSHLDGAYGDVVAWLRRSGALHKAVDVDAKCWDECHTPVVSRGCQLVGPGLVKLLSEGPGIYHLGLSSSNPSCFMRLLDLLDQPEGVSAPNLTIQRPWDSIVSLDITFTHGGGFYQLWDGHAQSSQSSVLRHLPRNITSLKLALPPMKTVFPNLSCSRRASVNIPPSTLERLTSLSIECDWDGNHFLPILRHCSKIEHLVLDYKFFCWTLPASDPLVVKLDLDAPLLLEGLRTLSLRRVRSAAILRYIKAPGLVSLDIDGGIRGQAGDSAKWLSQLRTLS